MKNVNFIYLIRGTTEKKIYVMKNAFKVQQVNFLNVSGI